MPVAKLSDRRVGANLYKCKGAAYRKEYSQGSHLIDEAPQRPNVCLGGVGVPLDHLRTHVARGSDNCDCLFESALEAFGRTKRAYFEVSLVVEVDVLRGYESVYNMSGVDILKPHEQLHQPAQEQFFAKAFLFISLLL